MEYRNYPYQMIDNEMNFNDQVQEYLRNENFDENKY